jgi:hypothetical protein
LLAKLDREFTATDTDDFVAKRTISLPALTRANPRYTISAPRWS